MARVELEKEAEEELKSSVILRVGTGVVINLPDGMLDSPIFNGSEPVVTGYLKPILAGENAFVEPNTEGEITEIVVANDITLIRVDLPKGEAYFETMYVRRPGAEGKKFMNERYDKLMAFNPLGLDFDAVLPQQESPTSSPLVESKPQPEEPNVVVGHSQEAQEVSAPLILIDTNWERDLAGSIIVHGRVRNVSDKSYGLWLTAVFEDAKGKLVTTQDSHVKPNPLQPGAIGTFDVFLLQPSPTVHHYNLKFREFAGEELDYQVAK